MNNWSEKLDTWLVEALKGTDPKDKDRAFEELKARYEADVNAYIKYQVKKQRWVEDHAVDDLVQETFFGFWQSIKGKKEKKIENIKAYLLEIAHNKYVDALKREKREKEIEQDLAVSELMRRDGVEDSVMQEFEPTEYLQPAIYLPYSANLSPCQRVIWVLQRLYEYPPRTVARLMGKSRGTIDTHLSVANRRVKQATSDMTLSSAVSNSHTLLEPSYEALVNAKFFVERFSEPTTPLFTPEELAPLGLTVEELQKNYVASLIFPELNEQKWSLARKPLVLALSNRRERKRWENKMKIIAQCIQHNAQFLATQGTRKKSRGSQLFALEDYLSCKSNPNQAKQYSVNLASQPEEYLVSVQVDGENMILESLMEYPLTSPSEGMISKTYLPVEVHHSMGLFQTGVLCRPDLYTGDLEDLMGLEEGFLNSLSNVQFIGLTYNLPYDIFPPAVHPYLRKLPR